MSPESPESPETISGKGRERESGKSGISIDTGLWTSPETGPIKAMGFPTILIVGSPHEVQAKAHNPKAIFSSLTAMETRYNVPVVWEASPETAALLVERWSWFFWRERSAIGRKIGPCPIPAAIVSGHVAAISNR
jgi:hypothetical protein